MSVKNEEFKEWGPWTFGYARVVLEPIKPSKDFPSRFINGYLVNYGKGHRAVYCQQRYHWLLEQLMKQGVSLEHFSPHSKKIPARKCKEIAGALRKLRGRYEVDERYLEDDIAFWRHCGGLIHHGWMSVTDVHSV